MRLIIAGLLIVGGGLAALALVWAFYSTQSTAPSSTAPIVSEQQTPAASDQNAAPTDKQETTPADTAAAGQAEADRTPQNNTAEADAGLLLIEVVRIGPDGSAVFAGKGSPEADIHIFEQDKTLARADVSSSGEWVAIADTPLSPGNHLIIAEMRTTDGDIIRADQAIVVELAASGEDKPLVALVPMTDQAEAQLVQAPDGLVSPQKDGSADAGTQTDDQPLAPEVAALLVEPARLQILTLSWADSTMLVIKGTSAGGRSVDGSLNDIRFSAQPEAETGSWTARVDTSSLRGTTARLLSQLLDQDREVIASRLLEFDLSQLDIGRDGSDMVVIEKGDMLWRIAYRTYGNGIRYLDIVRRNQGRITDPDLIYPAQVFALPDEPDDNQQ